VAVKTITQSAKNLKHGGSRSLALDPIAEAELSECISHPNLVQTYKHSTRSINVGADELETWIVLEWCEGGTLAEYCDKLPVFCAGVCRAPPFSETVDICRDIASAGAYLHSRGIIHGDLNPKSVLLKGNVSHKGFICKVCDFGLAAVIAGDVVEIGKGRIGTLTHMAPESLSRDRFITKKIDVWSFGMLVLQVFTRKSPYHGLSWAQVVHQVSEALAPKFPNHEHAEIKEIYEKCTMKDPAQRPSFQEILVSLNRADTSSDVASTASGNSGERRSRLLRKELS
jgi:serine/threonine protein kinase